MSVYPTIPADYKTLKNACRKGLTTESRQYWWPVLIQVQKDSIVSEYPDIDGTSERLTSLVCEYFAGGGVTDVTFEWKTEVIMKSLSKRKEVENPELLRSLIRIIAECIPQIEVCFLIGSDIVSNPNRYVGANKTAHSCRLYTFTEVLKRYLPKTAATLEEIGALKAQFLNLMFVDFFRTLLPRQSVLSLIDAYLLEGWRILLRYGLSLIKGYKAQIKAQRFSSGEDFWQAVQASARSMSTSIDTAKVESILQAIKINSFDVERPMIERLYRPMNISTASIEKYMAEGKRSLKSKKPSDTTVFESKLNARGNVMSGGTSGGVSMFGNDTRMNTGSSNGSGNNTTSGGSGNNTNGGSNMNANNTTSGSGSGGEKISNALSQMTNSITNMTMGSGGNSGGGSSSTTRNSTSVSDVEQLFVGNFAGTESEKNRPLFEYLCQKSDILLMEDTSRLLQMLPSNLIFEGLELAFSTVRCGWALASLYSEVKEMRPCVILIQTLPNTKPNKRLGQGSQYGGGSGGGESSSSHGHISPSRMSEDSINTMTALQLQVPRDRDDSGDVMLINAAGNLIKQSTSSSNNINNTNNTTTDNKSSNNHTDSNTNNNTNNNINNNFSKDDDDDDENTNFTEDEVDRGVILGVYLPCVLSPPSTTVRGDPEAFVFRLTDGLIHPVTNMPMRGTGGKGVKFPSVVSTQPAKSRSAPPGSDAAAVNQFAVCASSYMSFGASSKHSTNALRIDEELRWVASGPSDTYNSPPLLMIHECDANAMIGLTMAPAVPERRSSFTSVNYTPTLTPVQRNSRTRSRSSSSSNQQEAAFAAMSGGSGSGNNSSSNNSSMSNSMSNMMNNLSGPPSPNPHHHNYMNNNSSIQSSGSSHGNTTSNTTSITNTSTSSSMVPGLSISLSNTTLGNALSSMTSPGAMSPNHHIHSHNNNNSNKPTTSLFDLDRRAGIKQIEVWCAKNSYTKALSNKRKK